MKLKMTFLASLTVHVLLAQWKPLPMYGGGFITDLVPHPTNVNTLVATCDVGGLFITTNDCVTWTSLTANVPKIDGDNFKVRSFAFNPITPTTMYYLSGNAPEVAQGKIWKTINSGMTWTGKDLPIGVAGNNAGRYAGATILVHPTNQNRLYIAGQPTLASGASSFNADGGVQTSNDGGSTWTKIGGTALDKTWITKIRFAPNNPNILYISAISKTEGAVSTVGKGLWEYNMSLSTATLTHLTSSVNIEVMDFDFDATAPATIITTGVSGNFKSLNSGSNWTALTTPTGLTYNLFAKAHPTQGGVWYFGTFLYDNNSIITTSNAGLTWQKITYSSAINPTKVQYPSYLSTNYKPTFGNNMACLLIRGSKAYLSDWFGVWRTGNANQYLANATNPAISNWTWTFYAQGIHNMVQVRTSVHPTDLNRFYANVADIHYYESKNAGATMLYTQTYSNDPKPMNMTCRVDFHKNNTSIGFMCGTQHHGDKGKIYKTTNGGTNWVKLPTAAAAFFEENTYNVTDLQLTPAAGTVIVGVEPKTAPNQIYRSNDGGATWAAWDQGLTVANFFRTWEKHDRLLKDANGTTFYIWRSKKLYRRNLTDANWTDISNLLPNLNVNISNVQTHRNQSNTLYIAQATNVLYKSTNNGSTWTPISTPSKVETFAVALSGTKLVYQTRNSNNEQILMQSTNSGVSWTSLSTQGFNRMIDGLVFLNDTRLLGWTGGNSGYWMDIPGVAATQSLDYQENISIQQPKSSDGTLLKSNAIYPNPVQDWLTIDADVIGKEIQILNNMGQIVFLQKQATSAVISVHDLQNGIYFVKMGTEVFRFVKF